MCSCESCLCLIVFFFFSSRRRHTRCALVTGVQTCALPICLETKLAALKRHIVVQVIAENIRLDDEIPTLRQILIRPRLVELLSKLRDVGLKGVVRNLSAMGDQADFALCRTGREELENPNLNSLLLIIRRQRERAKSEENTTE